LTTPLPAVVVTPSVEASTVVAPLPGKVPAKKPAKKPAKVPSAISAGVGSVPSAANIPSAVNAGGGSSAPNSGLPIGSLMLLVGGTAGAIAAGSLLVTSRKK
jgi:hypothetical protein